MKAANMHHQKLAMKYHRTHVERATYFVDVLASIIFAARGHTPLEANEHRPLLLHEYSFYAEHRRDRGLWQPDAFSVSGAPGKT